MGKDVWISGLSKTEHRFNICSFMFVQ